MYEGEMSTYLIIYFNWYLFDLFVPDDKSDEKYPSSQGAIEALRAQCELVVKERDAAQRLFAETQDQLDSVVRLFHDMKHERDLAFERLQHENSYRSSFRYLPHC